MRDLKFRVWTGLRFWYFDIHSGINKENDDKFGEVEQFTGLKDKNGKEIYEGDIVYHAKESNLTTQCTMIGPDKVIWDNENCRFILGNGDNFGMIFKAYEIIGNVHENKDLLDEN